VLQTFQARRAIGWAGLLAGFLDITTAAVLFGLKGKSPSIYCRRSRGDCWACLPFRGE
jgi:hypothetical protein